MKLPPGVYAHRRRFKAQPSIGNERVYLGLFDTAEEAEAEIIAARKIHAEKVSGRTRGTFRSWATDWLDERETSGAHRNAVTDRSRMTRHVLSAEWVDLPIRAIKRQHLRTWLHALERTKAAALSKDGKSVVETTRALAPRTVMHVCTLVRKCFADAIEAGKCSDNPADGVRSRRRPEVERAIHLTLSQITDLLAVPTMPKRTRAAYTVAIYTGVRAGELWALSWADVHEEAEHPEIVVRVSHRGSTKTGAIRHVPLLPPAVAALREQRARAVDGCPLVFPSGALGRGKGWKGWHQASKGYDAQWSRWAKHAGIDSKRIKFGHCRHTCGAHLAAGSWGHALTLYQVAAWLGHSDSRTTEEHYAHLTPEALHGARGKLASAMVSAELKSACERPT